MKDTAGKIFRSMRVSEDEEKYKEYLKHVLDADTKYYLHHEACAVNLRNVFYRDYYDSSLDTDIVSKYLQMPLGE
jgi:phage terminase large subunit